MVYSLIKILVAQEAETRSSFLVFPDYNTCNITRFFTSVIYMAYVGFST